MKRILLLLVMLITTQLSQAQTQPVSYYTCDSTIIAGSIQDNKGVWNMSVGGTYQIVTGGQVGKFLRMNAATTLMTATTTSTSITGSFTVEFLWKPGRDFNTTDLVRKNNGAWSFKIDLPQTNTSTPKFTFVINTGSTSTFNVLLDGSNRKSLHYYLDGNWHHMAIQYNTSNGIRKVFVDGVCPAGFSDTISGSPISTGDNRILFNSTTSYRKYYGDIDEIALYNVAVAPAQLYQNYLRSLSGLRYSFTNFVGTIPTISVSSGLDSLDFAPGTVLPTTTTQTVGAYYGSYNQLLLFPQPRYKPGHNLMRNMNWMQLDYLSGRFQPGVNSDSLAKITSAINLELAKYWNYRLLLNPNAASNNSQYSDTTTSVGKLIKTANANPQIPTSVITFWSQLNPANIGRPSGGSYAFNDNLPANYYVRNSSGQFLTLSGAVTSTPSAKVLSPAAPLDSIYLDGEIMRYHLTNLKNALTRPINYISENDEVVPSWQEAVLAQDPAIVAQKTASGLDWLGYMGQRKAILTNAYRDRALVPLDPKPPFQVYKVEGRSTVGYSEYKKSQFVLNGQYYANPDFYPRWATNWRNWTSSWNGLQHIVESRNIETAGGDNLYGPFISAGWNEIEDGNIRPGDWMGLLKLLAATGAEYFHTGFFNEAASYNPPNPPPANPANYAWQVSTPCYVQAAISRAEDLLKNGILLPGDMAMSIDPPKAGNSYQYKTGNVHIPVMVRKLATGPCYLIVGTIPRSNNDKNNAPLKDTVTVVVDGDTLTFEVRRQGSMYVYDKRNPAAVLWYQLDKWHEATHPNRWGNDIVIEGELADSSGVNLTMRTERPTAAPRGNWTTAVTALNFPTGGVATYNISSPYRNAYWIYVRAKQTGSTAGSLSITRGSTRTAMNNVASTTYRWYKVALGNIDQNILPLTVQCRKSRVAIDKIVLSPNEFLKQDYLDSK